MKNISLTLLLLASATGMALAQDTCEEALPIGPGLHNVEFITPGGVPEPICAENGAINGPVPGGMWYTYTPPQDTIVEVTTILVPNIGADTRLHVYEGACDALVCVAGNDDNDSDFRSAVSWEATAETTYYIAFDNRWESDGFDFELNESGPDVQVPAPFTFTSVLLPELDRSLGTADLTGDYLDDVFNVNSINVFKLEQAEDGLLNYVSTPTEPAEFNYSWSIAAGDLNADGFNDLLYGGGQGVSFMYSTPSNTSYTTWSSMDYVFSQRSNFIDLNNDGHLDAFVCHDVQPNVYYINDGAGNLTFFQGGLSDVPDGGNYGSIFVDYNNDGLPDLFIAKCRGGASLANYNQLFRNDGNGVFTEVSEEAGLYDPMQTWSSAWADFDNDGWMDVFIGSSSGSNGHKLMRNNGDGTFTDVTEGSGFDDYSFTSVEWVSFDFDNDGFADVFGANGRFMHNNGDMTFSPVDLPAFGQGPVGDLNNDGFLDLATSNRLYYNDGNENNWIKLGMKGVASNINGIGARVELYTPAGKQIRDVQSGIGFRYMYTLNVHFGIGEQAQIDSLVVNWPSGVVDTYYNPEINMMHILVEGEGDEGAPTATVQFQRSAVKMYPNPTREVLNFEGVDFSNPSQVSIWDLQGRLMLQTPLRETVNVNQLAPGNYLLRITSQQGVAEGKFVRLP